MWIRLHGIIQEYSDPQLLISIANLVGIPQAIDLNTKDFVFGHYARIQVEVDLLHTLHPKLLIEREGYSFEVLVSYENVPKFYSHCHFIGHLVGECNSVKRIQETTTKTASSKLPSTNYPSKKAQPTINTVHAVGNKQPCGHTPAQIKTNTSYKLHSAANTTTTLLVPAMSHKQSQQVMMNRNAAHTLKPSASPPQASPNVLPLLPATLETVVVRNISPTKTAAEYECTTFAAHSVPPCNENTNQLQQQSKVVTGSADHHIHIPEDPALAIKEVFESQSPQNGQNQSFPDFVVPCSFSSKHQKKSKKTRPIHHSTSFYTQHSTSPSVGIVY